jgi:hypothetical protein
VAEPETITGIPDRQPVPGVRRGPGARRVVLYAATLLFVGALLGIESPDRLFEEVLWAHRHLLVAGFGALIVLELTALVGRRWIRKRSLYYVVALVVTSAIVVLVRLFEGSGMDLAVRDIIGLTGFLLLSASLDKPLRREHHWLRGWPRRVTEVLGLLAILGTLYPMLVVGTYYAGRAGAFPIVVDLASDWQEPFLEIEHAELFRGKGPDVWPRRAGRTVAVLFFDGTPGGGVTVWEPYKDWRDFDELSMHFYSKAERPVEMALLLSDRSSVQPLEERTDWPLTVMPGANDFRLDIQSLAQTPSGREMKLSTMRKFGLYLAEPTEPFLLYLHHVRISEK